MNEQCLDKKVHATEESTELLDGEEMEENIMINNNKKNKSQLINVKWEYSIGAVSEEQVKAKKIRRTRNYLIN